MAVEMVNHGLLGDDVAIVSAEFRDFFFDIIFPSVATLSSDVHGDLGDLVVVRGSARVSDIVVTSVVLVDKEDSDVVLGSLIVGGEILHELNGPVGDSVAVVGGRSDDVEVEDGLLNFWCRGSAGASTEDLGVGHGDLADKRAGIGDPDSLRVASAVGSCVAVSGV